MLLVVVVLACDSHSVSNEENRVETHTKLTNKGSVASSRFLEFFEEFYGRKKCSEEIIQVKVSGDEGEERET